MKLTSNFSKSEFDSKDGAEMPDNVLANVKIVAEQLEVLRGVLNVPIKINSAYRSPAHNASPKVKGVKNSKHLTGKAVDIVAKGITTNYLAYKINELIFKGKMLEGGIGIYDTFVHYDIYFDGKKKRRWDYRKK
jgi:uncharacterized protein YcbK (DUF882 family)